MQVHASSEENRSPRDRRQAEGVPTELTGRTSERKRMQDRLAARPQELEKELEKLL